jgi:hypothetical protein
MSTVLSDADLDLLTDAQKRSLLEQRLHGYSVTLATSLLERASIADLPGMTDQLAGADAAIEALRGAMALHRAELEALPEA